VQFPADDDQLSTVTYLPRVRRFFWGRGSGGGGGSSSSSDAAADALPRHAYAATAPPKKSALKKSAAAPAAAADADADAHRLAPVPEEPYPQLCESPAGAAGGGGGGRRGSPPAGGPQQATPARPSVHPTVLQQLQADIIAQQHVAWRAAKLRQQAEEPAAMQLALRAPAPAAQRAHVTASSASDTTLVTQLYWQAQGAGGSSSGSGSSDADVSVSVRAPTSLAALPAQPPPPPPTTEIRRGLLRSRYHSSAPVSQTAVAALVSVLGKPPVGLEGGAGQRAG
jgi:hypothetical protein